MIGSPCTDNATHSESGMVGAAWVRYRAFPQELQPELSSRACRVIPLQICGVLAPKAYRENGKCGWYRGRNAFRPDCGMEGFYFLVTS